MRLQTVFGKHIATTTTRGFDEVDTLLIPANVAAVRLNIADIGAACRILTPRLSMHDKTTTGRCLTCRICCTETLCCSNAGRVPVYPTAEGIAVANTIAAVRGIAAGSSMNNEAALRFSSTATGT